MSLEKIDKELQEAKEVLDTFMNDASNLQAIRKAASVIVNSVNNGGRVYSCGNGGSMSDAMHFAEELTGGFRENRPSIPAMAISDAGHITCSANDFGYEYIFSRFLEGFGKEGDILFAISTSGNSANVINAAKVAQERGMKIVGLTGQNGGKLAPLCDVEIRVSHNRFADRIQEIHIKVIHILVMLIEQEVKV